MVVRAIPNPLCGFDVESYEENYMQCSRDWLGPAARAVTKVNCSRKPWRTLNIFARTQRSVLAPWSLFRRPSSVVKEREVP
jgi:hypothetical protein